jgi:hypothetical protein
MLARMIKPVSTIVSAALLLASCTAASDATPVRTTPPPPVSSAPQPSFPGEVTKVLSQVDADRLLHNKGVSLQWIDWNTRGTAVVSQREGLWQLRAAQAQPNGAGR